LLWVLVAVGGVVLGAAGTYALILANGPAALLDPEYRQPSSFLADLSPQALIAEGSAAGGQWEWVETTGPAPSRCRTCMRSFVGHGKLDPKAGETSFIVNDFQHKVWAAITDAGGERLQSDDGRYHNGNVKTDFYRGQQPNRYREYQYTCYRIGDAYGVAHMIGYGQGEDMTVVLIVQEQ
jgi:hypothetical protein